MKPGRPTGPPKIAELGYQARVDPRSPCRGRAGETATGMEI